MGKKEYILSIPIRATVQTMAHVSFGGKRPTKSQIEQAIREIFNSGKAVELFCSEMQVYYKPDVVSISDCIIGHTDNNGGGRVNYFKYNTSGQLEEEI